MYSLYYPSLKDKAQKVGFILTRKGSPYIDTRARAYIRHMIIVLLSLYSLYYSNYIAISSHNSAVWSLLLLIIRCMYCVNKKVYYICYVGSAKHWSDDINQ